MIGRRGLLALLALFSLTACGKKGGLELPPSEAQDEEDKS